MHLRLDVASALREVIEPSQPTSEFSLYPVRLAAETILVTSPLSGLVARRATVALSSRENGLRHFPHPSRYWSWPLIRCRSST
ncbi:MAG: hypothetical protein ABSD85_01405 [Acidimicrobiales bacterium]|jgi:hypothetical protein